ncbi:MAG: NAD(P)H-dependent oxidoreductase [Candidatus Cryptobacteroides sp.]|nr:NAD(P)H-dependent oxidoreductase [Bacteroidales bacterium]
MEKLIIIDSCMRRESRTRVILEAAKEVLVSRYDIETIDVNSAALPPLTPEALKERTDGRIPEKAVAVAEKIAAADRLVIAAPFWDMSFPAALKAFFENLSLYGITFTDDGTTCTGLCRCGKVLYITTRGMDIPTGDSRDQGSSYLKALSSLWGLGEVITVAAWNLDYMSAEQAALKVRETAVFVRTIAEDF